MTPDLRPFRLHQEGTTVPACGTGSSSFRLLNSGVSGEPPHASHSPSCVSRHIDTPRNSTLTITQKTQSQLPPNVPFAVLRSNKESAFKKMLSRLATTTTLRSRASRTIAKAFLATKPPHTDPLTLIRDECHARKLCDEHGLRRPGVHWVFSVAVTSDDPHQVRFWIVVRRISTTKNGNSCL